MNVADNDGTGISVYARRENITDLVLSYIEMKKKQLFLVQCSVNRLQGRTKESYRDDLKKMVESYRE